MRPIVQVHTIEQWNGLNKETQSLILKNIRLKERLWAFLGERNRTVKPHMEHPIWAPCHKCEQKGWVLKKPRQPGIHPSQIPHTCDLKIYNEMIGKDAVQRIEPRLQLIFDIGHAVHGMFQSYGKAGAWGPIYKDEVVVNGEFQVLAEKYMIEGSADAENILTIDDIPDGPIYEVGLVHEYKTIKSDNFDKLSKPKAEHETQATIYAAILNRPIVVYLYFNKDNSNLVDFPVPFNPEEWKVIQERCEKLMISFNTLVPPKASSGYHCKDCPYNNDCDDYRKYLNKGIPSFRRF